MNPGYSLLNELLNKPTVAALLREPAGVVALAIAAFTTEQKLAALLRELRLLRGQPCYRYCMAWLIVATHTLVRVAVLWLAAQQLISRF